MRHRDCKKRYATNIQNFDRAHIPQDFSRSHTLTFKQAKGYHKTITTAGLSTKTDSLEIGCLNMNRRKERGNVNFEAWIRIVFYWM